MALTPYCTNDEVRAALGVTVSEIGDAVLDLPIYSMGLRREINRLSTSLPAAFSTVNAEPSPTDVQRNLLDSVKLFAIYAVARQAGAALAMAAPKSLNDDKSGFSRDSNSPYKDVLDRIEILFQQARQDLLNAFSEYSGAASATLALPPGLAVSSRAYDPVTGA
jgi:hypothetical protein